MYVERHARPALPSLNAIEASNAVRAENFRGLPEAIPLWRFREVLTKLGTELGLSSGAVVYALDLMGLLTEADWRGDGRAITYHAIRSYARKVGKAERTIHGYEHQLVLAGLVHRTIKHARRHDGMGNDARRTGLDWRSFGARMPELLQLLERRQAEEQHRLDLEVRVRAARRIVAGLIDVARERAGEGVSEDVQALCTAYVEADVSRLRRTLSIADLQRRLGMLLMLQDRLTVFLADIDPQPADQSANSVRPIDTTEIPPCPSDIRSGRPDGRTGLEKSGGKGRKKGGDHLDVQVKTMPPLPEIWEAAPDTWKAALGPETGISWPVLIDLARHFATELGVSPYAWRRALEVLGPSETALALVVLDRNRDHPVRPVSSVGGALVGMTRRAEAGAFNLAPSIYGILSRNGLRHGKGGRERRKPRPERPWAVL